MNAAAFIIASWTSTPYIKIALIGVAPALLYYFGISLSIYIKAIKLGDKKNEDDALPHFKKAFLEFVIYIIPLIVLVVFLVKMYSPQVSLFYAILALLLVGLIQQVRGSGLAGCVRGFVRKTLDGLAIGSKSMAMIAVVMAIMGVVVQILTATGLPSKISQFVITLAGDNLFLLALFVAITCLIFGMGMPAAPAYILAALLGAPALTAFGVPLLAAHFFVFYYGELSAVTPPVAIGALVASGLAKGDFMKTSLISMRLAVCGFAIPFMFIFRPEILLMGTLWEFFWSILMVMVFAFACVIFFENFFLEKLILPERIGAAAAAFCCIWPHFAFDFVGLALIALVVASHLCRHRRAVRAQGAEGTGRLTGRPGKYWGKAEIYRMDAHKKIVICSTLDTKGEETLYLKAQLEERGAQVSIIDIGLKRTARSFPVQFTQDQVAESAGSSFASVENILSRFEASKIMMEGLLSITQKLCREGNLDGMMSLGGSGGTTIASYAMQNLPLGIPKIIVGTMASGNTVPYVQGQDILLINSVADIQSINFLTEYILGQAAAVMCAMIDGPKIARHKKKAIGITGFGVTTPCVQRARSCSRRWGMKS